MSEIVICQVCGHDWKDHTLIEEKTVLGIDTKVLCTKCINGECIHKYEGDNR